ncbi:MAG: 23S rRNA (uracil(1939)-C(5))-methyltransferase RlmD, partial [Deltaproteobacteria bacterium]|nr:23S rRNA (uracil(1939)-C(5))-methyltransferase RlmD [Deltaproteobacteria bacterium]
KLGPIDRDVQEKIEDLLFLRDTRNFYQVNYAQNKNMLEHVRRFLAPCLDKHILDLYCGTGNFSLFLARDGAHITGMESNKLSVSQAKANAALNSINDCRFIVTDLDHAEVNNFPQQLDAALLNPPRTGCSQNLIKALISSAPQTIVYVSCNPATLARDLKALAGAGYQIETIQPFDMFPQTFHIETIT